MHSFTSRNAALSSGQTASFARLWLAQPVIRSWLEWLIKRRAASFQPSPSIHPLPLGARLDRHAQMRARRTTLHCSRRQKLSDLSGPCSNVSTQPNVFVWPDNKGHQTSRFSSASFQVPCRRPASHLVPMAPVLPSARRFNLISQIMNARQHDLSLCRLVDV